MANVYNKPIVVLGGGAEKPVDYGIIYEGKYRVRYFDIDGTVLKIEYVTNGGKCTPPNNPNYDPDYLIFDEWNYDIENYVVEQPTDVGATYDTIDSALYIYIKMSQPDCMKLMFNISGYTTIDWGDGTVDTSSSHTYTKEGYYWIKINASKLKSISFTGYVFATYSQLNAALIKVYIGKKLKEFSNASMAYARIIKVISLPSNLSVLPYIPDSGIKTFIVPKNITSISNCNFQNCPLENFILNNNEFEYPTHIYYRNPQINEIQFSKNTKSIKSSTIYEAYNISNIYIFKDDAVLTTMGVLNYYGMTVWVPDLLIEQYKTDSIWKQHPDRIKPLSWYPSLTDPNA